MAVCGDVDRHGEREECERTRQGISQGAVRGDKGEAQSRNEREKVQQYQDATERQTPPHGDDREHGVIVVGVPRAPEERFRRTFVAYGQHAAIWGEHKIVRTEFACFRQLRRKKYK